MKKLGILFATVIMIMLFAMSVSAKEVVDSGECGAEGDNVTWVLYDDGMLVINGDGMMSLGAFSFNRDIVTVVIEDGITNIGALAFSDCSNLKSITICNSVKTIEYGAFSSCDSLVDVVIPNSVISIGESAFYMCDNLKNVFFGNSLTEIGAKAFYVCKNLKNVNFGSSLIEIGAEAFYECVSLSSLLLPDSINIINEFAFYSCSNLKNLYIGKGVKDIGEYAFSRSNSLEKVYIPSNVTFLRKGAFFSCSSLNFLDIDAKYIMESAFKGCKNLKNVVFGKNVYSIGDYCFWECNNIENVYWSTTNSEFSKIETGVFNEYLWESNFYYNHKHSYVNSEEFKATCLNEGEIIYRCVCGSEYSEVTKVDMNNHKSLIFKKWIIIPLCKTNGSAEYECECGIVLRESIPATNHANATTDAGKAPTTTEVGYTAGKYCPDCETWIEGHEEIPKLHSHIYNSSVVIKEPTCTDEGIKKYICDCGESYTTTISKASHFHKLIGTNPSTCFKEGSKIFVCACGDTITESIAKLTHENETQTTKATLTKNGGYKVICKNCGQISGEGIYYSPETIELDTVKYTYDGKAKKPGVFIEDKMGVDLKEGTDYTLTYASGRKNPGKYAVTITLKGAYEGETTLYFTILPGKTSKITATQSTDYVKLSWNKVTGATGYRVYQYNSKTGKYEKIKTLTGTSYTVKKLKAGTTYKFAVKAYSKADGETLWAASYKTITTATKPATPTLKATAGSKQATISWKKVTGATGYVVYMQDEFGDYEKIGTTKNTSYTRKKLTKGETYYFRVRAYKTVDGKNIYGGYKTVKVKVK